MLDVEDPQGRGDTSIPNPINEPVHDAHADVRLGQGPNIERLHERGADLVREGGDERGGPTKMVEASMASRHDQGEVIH